MKNSDLSDRDTGAPSRESGQAIVLVLLALGVFLLGFVALAVDFTNLWFHRQTAQTAADAACNAGAMDMLRIANGGVVTAAHLNPPNSFDCATDTSHVPCWYANTNGYASSLTAANVGSPGNTAGNNVSGSYPVANDGTGSICPNGATCPAPGVAPPAAGLLPPAWHYQPFLRIDIVDRVQVFFVGLLNGLRTMDVRAFSVCGLVDPSPGPSLSILNPVDAGSLHVSSSTVRIVGGPQRGIQVDSCANSSETGCAMGNPVQFGGGTLDLSMGGPLLTGSDMGIVGTMSQPGITSFVPGSTTNWLSPTGVGGDVLTVLSAPSIPMSDQSIYGSTGYTHTFGFGCPDATNGCDEFGAGIYSSGISIGSGGSPRTVIFDPGIYYVTGGFTIGSKACVRPSTAVGDGSGGTFFYFTDNSSISSVAHDCQYGGVTNFSTTTGGVTGFGVGCTAASQLPTNIKDLNSVGAGYATGSVLLAPCTGPYGDPAGGSNPLGMQRGILFMQNRAMNTSTGGGHRPPDWNAAGQYLLAGIIYFHQCVTSGSDTGLGCDRSNAYNTEFTFQGGGGYFLGNILVDLLQLGGSSGFTLDLVVNYSFRAMTVTLLR